MNSTSVSGKNWLFKKFDNNEVSKLSETYSLSEITAKLLSIRKKPHHTNQFSGNSELIKEYSGTPFVRYCVSPY